MKKKKKKNRDNAFNKKKLGEVRSGREKKCPGGLGNPTETLDHSDTKTSTEQWQCHLALRHLDKNNGRKQGVLHMLVPPPGVFCPSPTRLLQL